jgi:hypothetical protein
MSSIQDEISAFQRMQSMLESEHLGRWVLIHEQQLIGVYDSFEGAADDAVAQFGSGPFLIRRVGAPPITLPVSVMYHRPNAQP